MQSSRCQRGAGPAKLAPRQLVESEQKHGRLQKTLPTAVCCILQIPRATVVARSSFDGFVYFIVQLAHLQL